MYDFNGKAVPNCKFEVDTQRLLELIKERIKEGVDAFFKCSEKITYQNSAVENAFGEDVQELDIES